MNRAQHFVPQLYLKQFVAPSLVNKHVWIYEKDKAPRHAAPKEIAHERDFYSFLHDGERNNLVDEYFQSLEGGGAEPKLQELAETGRVFAREDKDFLAKFIGAMSARVPAARMLADEIAGDRLGEELRKHVHDSESFENEFKRLSVRLEPPIECEVVRQMLLKGHRFQQADDFYNLQMMLDMAKLNYEALVQMNWAVWRPSSDLRFITSDNPVVSILPQQGGGAVPGRSFNIPEIRILFPLSPIACLFCSRRNFSGFQDVPNTRVRHVNKILMGMAHRWIFASEKSAKFAALFDKIGGTGAYGNDFYTYRSDIFEKGIGGLIEREEKADSSRKNRARNDNN